MNLDFERVDFLHKDLMEKIELAKKSMEELDRQYLEKAGEASQEQFKAYLKYAAEKFGTDDEKLVVESIIKKIKVRKKK